MLQTSSNIEHIDEWVISGDRSKLGQVIRNLVSNSLKFTHNGGIIAINAVELHPYVPDTDDIHQSCARGSSVMPETAVPPFTHWLTIDVVDTGVGISKVSNYIGVCALACVH